MMEGGAGVESNARNCERSDEGLKGSGVLLGEHKSFQTLNNEKIINTFLQI